jgi:hypothetical protein
MFPPEHSAIPQGRTRGNQKNQKVWRRGRDSNPRYPFGYAGFQDRSHQPLGHLSGDAVYKGVQRVLKLVYNSSLSEAEYPRMELHHFGEVSQEIGQAVVAGIGMVLVFYAFLQQLLV